MWILWSCSGESAASHSRWDPALLLPLEQRAVKTRSWSSTSRTLWLQTVIFPVYHKSVKRADLGLYWKSCQNGGVYGPRWDGGHGAPGLAGGMVCSKYSGEITSLPGGWRDQLVPCDAAISSGLSPGPLRPGWVSWWGLHLQPLLITADEAKHLPLLDHVRHQLLPPASVQSANWCKSVNHRRERGRLTGMQSDSV